MVSFQDTLWCDGCGIEIIWEPIERDRLFFCCLKCQDGERCACDELDEDNLSDSHNPARLNHGSFEY